MEMDEEELQRKKDKVIYSVDLCDSHRTNGFTHNYAYFIGEKLRPV